MDTSTGCINTTEAKDKLSSLLEEDYDSIVSKSSRDIRRTNLFQMAIPITGPHITCKPYPILPKYQNFINEEIWLLENAGHISKSLSLRAAQVIIVPKKPDPLNCQNHQLHLISDY